jgi:hypothetical protein
VDIGPGKQNDKTYGSICLQTVQPKDLCIRDLGYFNLKTLDKVDQKGAYYISHLKLNTRIYQKNDYPETFRNGVIKKHSAYIQLDLENMLQQLKPGQTYELSDAYIGIQQTLATRVIIHRLTEEQTQKRLENQAVKEKRKALYIRNVVND